MIIKLNELLRNGWTLKHPNDVINVNNLHLVFVKQGIDSIVKIYDGTDILNA